MGERTILPHHLEAISRLSERFQTSPDHLALIIGGSIAKGWARPDSDVDFMLVVTDEEAARRAKTCSLPIFSTDFTDYPGGYVDGKAITVDFLREVADHGSEPARSAALGAWVEFDRTDGEVTRLVNEMAIYPAEGHEDRVRSYFSQLMVWNWFVGESEKRDDRYLMLQAVTSMALFGMRLILAENRKIYPYHKWVSRMVSECADRPASFEVIRDEMLFTPTKATAQAFVDAMNAWKGWDVPWNEIIQRFTEDREWNWRSHPAPIEDR